MLIQNTHKTLTSLSWAAHKGTRWTKRLKFYHVPSLFCRPKTSVYVLIDNGDVVDAMHTNTYAYTNTCGAVRVQGELLHRPQRDVGVGLLRDGGEKGGMRHKLQQLVCSTGSSNKRRERTCAREYRLGRLFCAGSRCFCCTTTRKLSSVKAPVADKLALGREMQHSCSAK